MTTLIDVADKVDDRETKISRIDRAADALGYQDGFLVDKKDDRFIQLDDDGFENLCSTLDIPKAFAKRLPMDLQETVIRRLISHVQPEYSLVLSDKHLLGFTKPEYPHVAVSEFVGRLSEMFGDDTEVTTWRDNGKEVTLKFSSIAAFEPQVGDVCKGLISTTLDRTWDSTPTSEAEIFRLVCSNGMVSPAPYGGKYRISGKDTGDVLEKYEEVTRFTFEHLVDKVVPGVADLKNHSVKDVIALLNSLAVQHNLSKRKLNELRGQLAITDHNEPIENLYDFWNFLTYQGTHNLDLGDNFQRSLQEVAGHLAVTVQDHCPTCGNDYEE